MLIAIGSDHAGFERKEEVRKYLQEKGFTVTDKGTFSEERADYPDFGHAVAIAVETKEVELGIILCGSGNGNRARVNLLVEYWQQTNTKV